MWQQDYLLSLKLVPKQIEQLIKRMTITTNTYMIDNNDYLITIDQQNDNYEQHLHYW
jgi:hypothetical protein